MIDTGPLKRISVSGMNSYGSIRSATTGILSAFYSSRLLKSGLLKQMVNWTFSFWTQNQTLNITVYWVPSLLTVISSAGASGSTRYLTGTGGCPCLHANTPRMLLFSRNATAQLHATIELPKHGLRRTWTCINNVNYISNLGQQYRAKRGSVYAKRAVDNFGCIF